MALFKVFRGKEQELNSISLHEGYAYFCQDTGNMFIDVSNDPGGRVQVNAYAAKELIKYNEDGTIAKEVDIDDLLLKEVAVPVANGGTGADNVIDARSNLDVYSKGEVDTSIAGASSTCYTAILLANGWVASGNKFIYSYDNTNLVVKNPPVITCTANLEEYSKIEEADATASNGIIFTTSEKPTANIGIIVTDIK